MAELTWLFMLRLTFVLAGADTGVFSISSCLSRAAASVDKNRFSEHHKTMRGQTRQMETHLHVLGLRHVHAGDNQITQKIGRA